MVAKVEINEPAFSTAVSIDACSRSLTQPTKMHPIMTKYISILKTDVDGTARATFLYNGLSKF